MNGTTLALIISLIVNVITALVPMVTKLIDQKNINQKRFLKLYNEKRDVFSECISRLETSFTSWTNENQNLELYKSLDKAYLICTDETKSSIFEISGVVRERTMHIHISNIPDHMKEKALRSLDTLKDCFRKEIQDMSRKI